MSVSDWQLGLMWYSDNPEDFEAVHVVVHDHELHIMTVDMDDWVIELDGHYEYLPMEDGEYFIFPDRPDVDMVVKILKKD